MALSINYKVDPNTVTLKLYRETGKEIDLKNLPLDQVVLDKTKTTYTYSSDSVVDRTHYSFVIEATDSSGNKVYSVIQNQVYLSNPGPGSSVVQRGRYDFGVMDVLTNEEFGTSMGEIIAELATDLPQRVSTFADSTFWYKCLVDNKVIFIPANKKNLSGPIISTTNSIYIGDYVKNGLFGNGVPLTFEGCPEIYKKGYSYLYRSSKFWLGDTIPDITTNYTPEDCTLEDNEVSMIFNLLGRNNVGDDTPGVIPTVGLNVPSFVAGDIDLTSYNVALPGVYVTSRYYTKLFNLNEEYTETNTYSGRYINALRSVVLELLD